MRIFISLNFDSSIKKNIENIQINLKKDISLIDHNIVNSIKWENKDKFHITMLFIGDVNEFKFKEINYELSKLSSKLSLNEMNEIRIELGNINAFPNLKSPKVLTLEVLNEDKKVYDLSEKINSALKEHLPESGKSFHPHITIGRVKKDRKVNLTEFKTYVDSNIKFSVNEFYLMESKLTKTGSEYSVIKKYTIK